ncbi:hypothetical protein [Tenacibaculum singaporense]|uniref:hypothetical protein n=1 Tax=Tenacibaculum singaporense TaxID=2358479 RepID=UPI000F6788E8|nr:hypothetical protein [Tenacibaculum singaporense]RSC96064.1 hypothetical protein EI424_02785 [Tenacibaculum singaporense]
MFKRITLVLVILFFSSCVGSKKIVEESTIKKQTEKKEVKKDSSNVIEKNGAIQDKVITPVASTGNDETDKKIDEILSKLNTTKKSGSNSYRQYYDTETRQLITDFLVAQTQNQKTVTNNESTSETTLEEQINSYVYKRITTMPWYLWVVIYFLLLDTKVVSLLANFIPGLKGATSILAIFKRK